MTEDILIVDPAASALAVLRDPRGTRDPTGRAVPVGPSAAVVAIRAAPFPQPRDFVFDAGSGRLALSLGPDGHPRLHAYLSAHAPTAGPVVGGRLGRTADGRLATSEWSGRYGLGWTDELRARFRTFMGGCGLPVQHRPWHPGQTAEEVG